MQAEYQLKDQFDSMQHQRRMKEIALNNSGKEKVANVTGEVILKAQDKSADNQSRIVEQKRDRALPLSQLEEMPQVEENPENPIPNILK